MKRLSLYLAAFLLVLVVTSVAVSRSVEPHYNRVLRPGPYKVSGEASDLHKSLFIADLHADSLLWSRNLRRRSSIGHVDFPRLTEANVSFQAFIVVTSIPRKLNIESNSAGNDMVRYLAVAEHWPPATWNSPKNRALYQAERLQSMVKASGGQFLILRSRRDLDHASPTTHKTVLMLGAEGAQPLEGKLANLDVLFEAGFRMMSPTHFTDTEIAGSASGATKGGLTPLGRQWVTAMESKHMLIDLAHASPATIRDVTAIATRPIVVSHTGVKGTCDNNRNLSDEQLRAVTRTGGVVGIGFWQTATCGTDARAIARAVRHATSVVGVEHVSLGSDFDGATTMPFDVTGLATVTNALMKEGFSEREIRLIMGENVRRVLAASLPD